MNIRLSVVSTEIRVVNYACFNSGPGGRLQLQRPGADYQVRQVRVGGAVTMPIGGMQNRLRRIPRPWRRLGHGRESQCGRGRCKARTRCRSTPNPLTSDTDEPSALGRKLSVVRGELVQTAAGKWITHPPSRCPNGRPLGPGEVLVGRQACLGHGGGRTTWRCPPVRRAKLTTHQCFPSIAGCGTSTRGECRPAAGRSIRPTPQQQQIQSSHRLAYVSGTYRQRQTL
jgi:hypothetical protein